MNMLYKEPTAQTPINDGDAFRSPSELKEAVQQERLASLALRSKASESTAGLLKTADAVRSNAFKSPSMGIALTMHMHIVIACKRHRQIIPGLDAMLEDVLANEALVASAFAEGIPGQDIFSPSLTYDWNDRSEIWFSGMKRPCSLASIADYFVASCVPANSSEHVLRLAVIPAVNGVQADRTFWRAPYLVAADTNIANFNNVKIPSDNLSTVDAGTLETVLAYGMSIFNVLACSSYAGVMDRVFNELPDHCLHNRELAIAKAEFDVTSLALSRSMASFADEADARQDALSDVLALRYQYEELLSKTSRAIQQRAGGVAILSQPIVMQLLNVAALLKYHPISRSQFLETLLSKD